MRAVLLLFVYDCSACTRPKSSAHFRFGRERCFEINIVQFSFSIFESPPRYDIEQPLAHRRINCTMMAERFARGFTVSILILFTRFRQHRTLKKKRTAQCIFETQ